MSIWSYVQGIITVEPAGRTQPEKRYILDTVLDHLPHVTGSEGDMNVYAVQKAGHNLSCSHDEFGMRTDNLIDWYGYRNRKNGRLLIQRDYILVVDGALRDRSFETTKHEFMKWICRLAKRVYITDVMVEISSYDNYMLIRDDHNKFWKMFESMSWEDEKTEDGSTSVNWCEYLMWEPARDSRIPIELVYKYFDSPEDAAEFIRRKQYQDSE